MIAMGIFVGFCLHVFYLNPHPIYGYGKCHDIVW